MDLVREWIGIDFKHPLKRLLPMRRHRVMYLGQNAVVRQIRFQFISAFMTDVENVKDIEIALLPTRIGKVVP